MFNHLEYDATTLRDEYFRDLSAGRPIALPTRYFPDDDPTRPPVERWRPYAQLLFTNWVADICDAVLPSDDGKRSLDWMLAEPAVAHGAAAFADFLVVADETPCLLPEILRRVAFAGHRSSMAKAHRRDGGTALVELRVEGLSCNGAERLSRDLLKHPSIRRIVFRRAPGREEVNSARRADSTGCLFSAPSRRIAPGSPPDMLH